MRLKNSVFQKDRESSNTCLWNNLINFENPMPKEFSILPSNFLLFGKKKKKSCENFSIFTNIVIDVEAAKVLTNISEKYSTESFTMNKNFWL